MTLVAVVATIVVALWMNDAGGSLPELLSGLGGVLSGIAALLLAIDAVIHRAKK